MKIGLIGFGNLGKALVQGLLHTEKAAAEDILICAKSQETRRAAKEEFGVSATGEAAEVILYADMIILAVKANVFDELAPQIKECGLAGKIIISLMAGVPLDSLKKTLGEEALLLRAMPNLAISAGRGITALVRAEGVRFDAVREMFSHLGQVITVAEEKLESYTAFTACGLGFAAYLLEQFVQAGRQLGMSEKESEALAAETFAGALALGHFAQLADRVAPKGGATERGLSVLKEYKTDEAIGEAFHEAYIRAAGK